MTCLILSVLLVSFKMAEVLLISSLFLEKHIHDILRAVFTTIFILNIPQLKHITKAFNKLQGSVPLIFMDQQSWNFSSNLLCQKRTLLCALNNNMLARF